MVPARIAFGRFSHVHGSRHRVRSSRGRRHREVGALAVAISVALTGAASAQPARDGKTPQPLDAQSRARDLYRQGSQAYESGDNVRAIRLLREAWALHRTYDVAGALAQAELELGMYRDAAEHLEFCVRNLPLHESQEENDSVRAELDRLRARLARVQLRVVPDGAEVLVNGRVVGKSPLEMPIYLDPGTHTLGARLRDHTTERQLKTEAGLEQSVELRVQASAPALAIAAFSPAAAADASVAVGPSATAALAAAGIDSRPPAARDYTPSIVAAGVGVAAIVTGIGLTFAANSDDDEREKALGRLGGDSPCGAGSVDALAYECRKIDNLAESARTFRVASYLSFGAALASGVTAVLLWPSTKDSSTAGSIAPPSIRPSLGLSGEGIEANIAGVF